MSHKTTIPICFRISPQLHEQLKQVARREERSLSHQIRFLIKRAVGEVEVAQERQEPDSETERIIFEQIGKHVTS